MSSQNAAMGAFIVRLGPLLASDRGLIAAHRITTQRFSSPKHFGRQSIPQAWAGSSFGLAPFRQAIGFFIATHRVATDKFSVPKRFGRPPMPQPWARSSFGSAPFGQAIEVSQQRTESPPKDVRAQNISEGNPYRRHGHAHPSAWPPLGKRSVYS